MIQAICLENACQLLIIGDLYQANSLKKRVFQFILQHPNSITTTLGWQTLITSHPQLVTNIVQNFEKPPEPQSSISGSIFGGATGGTNNGVENSTSNVSLSHIFTNDH